MATYPRRAGIRCAACPVKDDSAGRLCRGWYVYYGLDGTYLRDSGRDANQILISDWI